MAKDGDGLVDRWLGRRRNRKPRQEQEYARDKGANSLTFNRSFLDAPVDTGWIACIDFGTAASKIAVVRKCDGTAAADDVFPLQIGPPGVSSERGFFLPSKLYLLPDSIHCGLRAEIVSANHADPSRELFESPKQLISSLNMPMLDTPASKAQDPSQRFTRRALLTLLLGFLAYRFDRSLAGIDSLNGRVPTLRISRPAWNAEADGETLLTVLLGRAFALARTIGDQFESEEGVPISVAFKALQWAESLEDAGSTLAAKLLRTTTKPQNCIERGFVPEATAVAASTIRPETRQGRLFTVADIGAGTSDFGAFISAPGRHKGGVFGEYVAERRMIEKAGNHLDSLVFSYLRELNELNDGVPADVPRIAQLRRELSTLKQTLFEEKELLEHGAVLDDFLTRDGVRAFISELRDAFRVPYHRVCGEAVTPPHAHRSVHIILTGGGAALPFVTDLPNDKPNHAHVVIENELPPWSQGMNSAVAKRLAVAVGGAMPRMPKQVD